MHTWEHISIDVGEASSTRRIVCWHKVRVHGAALSWSTSAIQKFIAATQHRNLVYGGILRSRKTACNRGRRLCHSQHHGRTSKSWC